MTLRTTWQNYPIDNPKRIEIYLHFNEKQFLKLTRGLIPEQMEDKWFIFYENEWLYFHRSWTVFGIYKAQLKKESDGYSITEFQAERNQEKYSNEDDNEDIDNFTFLIATGLLGIDVREIFAERQIKSETDYMKTWCSFGRMFYSPDKSFLAETIKSVLFGVAVGDALGVPVEFRNREYLRKNPVTDMMGYGTHHQPSGTFSDDSSLTFCLAEALTGDFDLNAISKNFVRWLDDGYWTAWGNVFDVGGTTRIAIERLKKGVQPDLAGGTDDLSNGNGSLMRIAPLLFYLIDKTVEERFEITRQVSSITHRHILSVIACFYYLEFGRQQLDGKDKFEIYKNLQTEIPAFLKSISADPAEIARFNRLFEGNIFEEPEDTISGSGYVMHTLEASIWCLLTTSCYKDAVLRAVNLGEDTDTTGAVTGGLAGLIYGFESIPEEWISQLARHDDIENLAERFAKKLACR